MPQIQTVDRLFIDITDEQDRAGFFEIEMFDGMREFVRSALDNQWRMLEPDEDFLNPDMTKYLDDLEAPEFPGWEMIADASGGKHGDYYVCIDPMMRNDFELMGTPQKAKAYGGCTVNPEMGDTRPGRGFRIYRKKKILGPVRLLPSEKFSEPLPLP